MTHQPQHSLRKPTNSAFTKWQHITRHVKSITSTRTRFQNTISRDYLTPQIRKRQLKPGPGVIQSQELISRAHQQGGPSFTKVQESGMHCQAQSKLSQILKHLRSKFGPGAKPTLVSDHSYDFRHMPVKNSRIANWLYVMKINK